MQHLVVGLEAFHTWRNSFTDAITKCSNTSFQKKKKGRQLLKNKKTTLGVHATHDVDDTIVLNEGLSLRTYDRVHLTQGLKVQ